jgi:hypothetical protein
MELYYVNGLDIMPTLSKLDGLMPLGLTIATSFYGR